VVREHFRSNVLRCNVLVRYSAASAVGLPHVSTAAMKLTQTPLCEACEFTQTHGKLTQTPLCEAIRECELTKTHGKLTQTPLCEAIRECELTQTHGKLTQTPLSEAISECELTQTHGKLTNERPGRINVYYN
jgi:hypothetical protein